MIIPQATQQTSGAGELPSVRFNPNRDFSNPTLQNDLRNIGQAANSVENASLQILAKQQRAEAQAAAQADAFRVTDTETQLQLYTHDLEKSFNNYMGADALDPKFRKDIAQQYNTRRDELAKTLSNDSQKMMFMEKANQRFIALHDKIANHESGQYKSFQSSTLLSKIGAEQQGISLNYGSKEYVNEAISNITKSHVALAGMYGKSPSFGILEANKDINKSMDEIAKGLADSKDVAGLTSFIENYAGKMSPDAAIKSRGILMDMVNSQHAIAISDTVIEDNLQDLSPNRFDKAFNALMHTESANRQWDDNGRPLGSSAGAKGIAQIMPTTGPIAAKLAGVKWDEELFNRKRTGDPIKDRETVNYHKALGRAYFNEQLTHFDGDLRKAYAAYNAGPGNVEKAIKNTPPGKDWLDYLPTSPKNRAETINYVKVNMEKFNSGASKKPSLSELQDQALQHVGNDPELRKRTIDEVTRHYEVKMKEAKQKSEESYTGVLQAIYDNKGDFSQLSDAQLADLTPQQRLEAKEYAGKLSKGVPVETDWKLYTELIENPALLKDTNLATLKPMLGATEYKHLLTEKGKTENPGSAYQIQADSQLKTALGSAGVELNPKTEEEFAQLGRVKSMFKERIDAKELELKRKANSKEVQEVINELFKPVAVKTWAGLSSETKPRILTVGTDKIELSKYERDKIVRALKDAAPNTPITESDIQEYYRLIN